MLLAFFMLFRKPILRSTLPGYRREIYDDADRKLWKSQYLSVLMFSVLCTAAVHSTFLSVIVSMLFEKAVLAPYATEVQRAVDSRSARGERRILEGTIQGRIERPTTVSALLRREDRPWALRLFQLRREQYPWRHRRVYTNASSPAVLPEVAKWQRVCRQKPRVRNPRSET
jgi:hypothetical protein